MVIGLDFHRLKGEIVHHFSSRLRLGNRDKGAKNNSIRHPRRLGKDNSRKCFSLTSHVKLLSDYRNIRRFKGIVSALDRVALSMKFLKSSMIGQCKKKQLPQLVAKI